MATVIEKKMENPLHQLLPIAAVTAYIGFWIYLICREHAKQTRKRDLQQMELGIKIGSAIRKGFENAGIDAKQDGKAEGQEGQQAEEAPERHEGGGEETV